ncbi:MAG: Ig-like domain-containing protein, partial [Archangium sp.]
MNLRATFALFSVTSAAVFAQTAVPDTQRLQSGGVFLTPTTGNSAHPGFCGMFAKQAEATNGIVNNVTTALDLIENTTPAAAPTRSQLARELVPVADLVNQNSSGDTHTPDVRMAWTTNCSTYGGDLSGERYAYRLRGNLNITSAGTKTFYINSDDGYSLRIGGVTIAEYNANRGVAGDSRRASFTQPGVYPIELIYWEQGGNSVMELFMADAQVCFNAAGGSSATCNATFTDRTNAGVLTAAQAAAAGLTIMGSTQVGIPTWEPAADNCSNRVGTANTLCVPTGTAACGNGVIDATSSGAEQCDDGNSVTTDGCNACAITTGYACNGTPSVCAPAPVVVTAPAAAALVNTTTPVINGTGLVGATVTVTEGAVTLCTATVNASGNWTCTSAALAQGAHTVSVTQSDGTRTSSPVTRPFTVDSLAPAVPVVATPASGSTTNVGAVVFSGTAEAGSTVRVFVDGSATAACTTTAGVGGAWSCTASPVIADGAHTVRASATDAANNTSALSIAQGFTVDTTPPGAPTLTSPTNGSTLATATPTVSGTAENNSSVTVFVDGAPYCTTTASAMGAFSCAGTTPVSQGAHAFTARATDAVGNTGALSNTLNVTVDTVAPPLPVLTAPANGSSLATLSPTFSGTSTENGTTVRVFVDGNTTTPVCTATVTAGTWSCSATLTAGAHTAQVRGVDAAGNTSALSAANAFTLDVTAPAAPVISSPTTGSATNVTTPLISGTAEAGSTVAVFDGATQVCTAVATGGTWSCNTSTLAPGSHTLTARATDAAGNVSPVSNTVTLTVDTTPPAAPVVTAPAQNAFTNDTTPTFSGTGEAGATVSVVIGGVTVCTATVAVGGAWSCDASVLTPGAKSATVTQRDPAGNVSPATTRNFT